MFGVYRFGGVPGLGNCRGAPVCPPRRRPAAFLTLGLLVFLHGCNSEGADAPESGAPGATARHLDPTVAALLELGGRGEQARAFVGALEGLAMMHGWQARLTECAAPLGVSDWDVGQAVAISASGEPFMVAILRGWDHAIPGNDVHTLILLDARGQYRDHLTCAINSRLSRMHSARFHTVVPPARERDGARLVIRLDGMSVRGNFSHTVHHGGRELDCYWGDGSWREDQPTKWDERGLCRVAIREGKLAVLFPREAEARRRPPP